MIIPMLTITVSTERAGHLPPKKLVPTHISRHFLVSFGKLWLCQQIHADVIEGMGNDST